MRTTNPYRKLLSDTFLFPVSTFGSKILTFLLTPFYTHILSEAEYGVTDLLIQTGNLLIPIVSMGILNGVMRFGLDKGPDPRSIFTTGLIVILLGNLILALCLPLFQYIGISWDYAVLLLLYVMMANLHSLCGMFSQILGRIRLFALSGILCTGIAVGCNILLLAVLRMGVTGYILANVMADAVSAVVLFFAAGLGRFIRLSQIQGKLAKQMFQYCLPLVPVTVCAWIINISDRYFISYLIGAAATGLYAVANKIGSILSIASGIFTSAWQLSAAEDRSKEERAHFFTNVFSVYEAGTLILASLLSLVSPFLMRFLAAPGYFEAWRYAPVLLLSTALSCLSSFFSSVYVTEKRSVAALLTALAGALVNLVGNSLLIPLWGMMGAAVATCASYLALFFARAFHSRTLIRIQWNIPRFIFSIAAMVLQCVMIEYGHAVWAYICAAGVAVLHIRPIQKALRSGLIQSLQPKRSAK